MHSKAKIAQLVEHQFPKLKVAGSNPVFRSYTFLIILYPHLHCEVRSNPRLKDHQQITLLTEDCFVPRNDVKIYSKTPYPATPSDARDNL
jgi:hypothetical protein